MRKLSAAIQLSGLKTRGVNRVVWGCVLGWALLSSPVGAQTAADKATARQLATQGIQYYQQGKHSEALDLLQRAEQLYDAPVHLIYIARTQAALGKLVEASETYRRLVRTDLPAGAPQPFKDAVADAQKELQQLEPKIPSLRIDVAPASTQGLQLKLDGEVVSTVVIGINRPTNPGKHVIEAAAADFDTATANVDLAQGSKQTVTLQMHAKPGNPAPVGPVSTPPATTPSTTAAPGETTPDQPPKRPADRGSEPVPFDKPPQIVIGVRGVFATLGGKLGLGGTDQASIDINGPNNTEAPLHQRMTSGGGVELDLGFRMRIGQKFALVPKASFQVLWLKAGTYYQQPIQNIIINYQLLDNQTTGSTVLSGVAPRSTTWKVGAALEFPRPSSAFSPTYFAELMLIASNQLSLSGTITTGNATCKMSDKYTGSGIGLGLGVHLPATRWLRLSPAITFSGVVPSHRDYSDTCPRSTPQSGIQGSLDLSTTTAVYTLTELSLGGEFLIGL